MKKYFLLSTLLSFFNAGESQVYYYKYKDQLEAGSKMIEAGYHFTLERTPSGKAIYKQYYPETGQMTHFITFENQKMQVKDGIYREWFDDGALVVEGTFAKGQKEGQWVEHDWSGTYTGGLKNGVWSRTGPQGGLLRKEHYQDGVLHGRAMAFDTAGRLALEQRYEMGELAEVVLDERAETVASLPRLSGCEGLEGSDQDKQDCADKKLMEFIHENLRYPDMARRLHVEGRALVRFVIDEYGNVVDVVFLRGLCAAIQRECIRLLQKMPKWVPATQDGRPVRVQFDLPIVFRLE